MSTAIAERSCSPDESTRVLEVHGSASVDACFPADLSDASANIKETTDSTRKQTFDKKGVIPYAVLSLNSTHCSETGCAPAPTDSSRETTHCREKLLCLCCYDYLSRQLEKKLQRNTDDLVKLLRENDCEAERSSLECCENLQTQFTLKDEDSHLKDAETQIDSMTCLLWGFEHIAYECGFHESSLLEVDPSNQGEAANSTTSSSSSHLLRATKFHASSTHAKPNTEKKEPPPYLNRKGFTAASKAEPRHYTEQILDRKRLIEDEKLDRSKRMPLASVHVRRHGVAGRPRMDRKESHCTICHVQETPQWRYVDEADEGRKKLVCNACYMRIKKCKRHRMSTLHLDCDE